MGDRLALIKVKDTGIGILPEQQKYIFERFIEWIAIVLVKQAEQVWVWQLLGASASRSAFSPK